MKIRKCCSSIFMIFFYFSALSQSSEIDSLSSAWQNPNLNDSLRMEALGKLIIKYIDEYPDTAIFLSQKMRSEGQRNEDLRTEARALYRLGLVYERFGKIDSAEFFHERSLELRLQSGDKSLIGTGYNAIAGVFYQRHNYDSAIHYFNKGLEIYKEINDPKAISNSLNNLGVCHYQMGEIRKCIEYYGQSLNIDKALGNKGGEAAMYSNIGMLYSRVGELNKALEYQRLAIKIYNEDSTLQGAIRAFHAWAAAESDAGNYDAALRGFTKGYRMSKRGRQNAQVIEALAGRALVYTRMGKNHLAQKDYEEVLALGGKSSNIYANLGSLYFDLGELKKAELYSKKALAHNGHGTIGERHDKGVAYFTLYEVYKAQENYPLALKMHEIQQQLKDSLVNSENQNSLLQKEQEYETKFITDSLQLVSANQAALAAQEIKYQKTRNRLIAFGGISIVVL